MKPLLLPLLLLLATTSFAQTSADEDAIRRVALDYIEGWYAGDAERIERSLHPQLAKRIVRTRQGESVLEHMGSADLVGITAQGGGRSTPPEDRRTDVTILDVFGNTASVRVDADRWIDYMHLARLDGEWKIINVLWEVRPGGG